MDENSNFFQKMANAHKRNFSIDQSEWGVVYKRWGLRRVCGGIFKHFSLGKRVWRLDVQGLSFEVLKDLEARKLVRISRRKMWEEVLCVVI